MKEVLLIKSGQMNMGLLIKEEHFPMRGIVQVQNGGHYGITRNIVEGIFDTLEISPQETLNLNGEHDLTVTPNPSIDDELTSDGSHLGVATPANAVSLSALFIFGQIFDEDIQGNGGTLPVDDVPANRLVNNISSTTGFQNFNIFPS